MYEWNPGTVLSTIIINYYFLFTLLLQLQLCEKCLKILQFLDDIRYVFQTGGQIQILLTSPWWSLFLKDNHNYF